MNMISALEFLHKAGVFYLATADDTQPKVRPFGIAAAHNGKLFICTKDQKDCFRQMIKNPKVEICAMFSEDWIRITGEVSVDTTPEAKESVLRQNPHAQNIYDLNDPHFTVLYLENAQAAIYKSSGGIVSVPLI